MLAQDGVGQIVEVGQESPHDISIKLRHSPQKVATNYARAHTSTISQVLDRGTRSPVDDVYLQKGQSWITVTSPTEGASHVIVWAPQEHNWDRRKATATIYWVDASWRFPAAITARSGGRQTLTTVVTRSSGQPVSGWIVKYDVLDGPPAVFSARGETSIEVRTDAAGRAHDRNPAALRRARHHRDSRANHPPRHSPRRSAANGRRPRHDLRPMDDARPRRPGHRHRAP